MILPNWFKVLWWIFLLILLSSLLLLRINDIKDGNTTTFDILVFLVWVSLLIAPIFAEINLFGLKLKKEIEELKNNISMQIDGIKAELTNTIDLRSQFSPSIFMYPPADSRLPYVTKEIRQILDELLREKGIQPSEVEKQDIAVDDDVAAMFAARYNIEKELRRIWNERFAESETRRVVPITQITNTLLSEGFIDKRIHHAIREVYAVASPSIHGEKITQNQLEFVKEIAPELIATLRSIT